MQNIHIDSAHRISGVSENFNVNLRNALISGNNKDVYIGVKNVIIPYTFYSIRNGVNNKFQVIYSNSSTKYIYITGSSAIDANISATVMASNIQTQLNVNTSGQVFTVTVPSSTGKLQITTTGSFDFDLEVEPLTYKVMGFTEPATYLAPIGSMQSNGVVNMTPEKYILVKANLGLQCDYDTGSSGTSSVLCKVPITAAFFSNILYEENEVVYRQGQINGVVNFSLWFDDNTPVNLNGHEWCITLSSKKIYYLQ